jgi:hypothetical protein
VGRRGSASSNCAYGAEARIKVGWIREGARWQQHGKHAEQGNEQQPGG